MLANTAYRYTSCLEAHRYNTRFQAALRNKFIDLVDKLDEMEDYDSEEPEPLEMLNTQIEYYTLLQSFQFWRSIDSVKNCMLSEIAVRKNWYRFENGVPIHQYWNCRDKKEAVQLWYTMDALEKMLKE
jgi:hypothetical protein